MPFLHSFSPSLDTLAIFGLMLFLCLTVGEITSRLTLLPRVAGYIILGYLLGPNILGIVSKPMLIEMQAIIDISLGLISFSIGRHLSFTWLKHDKGLLLTGIVGFAFTTSVVAFFVAALGWPIIPAFLAGVIATTTSPAVVLMVARDLSSQGPVTRRSLTLTSINNLLAVVIITLTLPFISEGGQDKWYMTLHSAYKLIGSIAIGAALYIMMKKIGARIIRKQAELQLILQISIIALAISTAKLFNLSNMLTLLTLGIAARNYDKEHALMEIDFGWMSSLFFIPLFFTTGCYLEFSGFKEAPFVILAFLMLRFLSQLTCSMVFAGKSSLTIQQSILIPLSLTPMTGIAIGITNRILEFSPEIGNQLLLILSSAIAILGILGPAITQIAFRRANESSDNL